MIGTCARRSSPAAVERWDVLFPLVALLTALLAARALAPGARALLGKLHPEAPIGEPPRKTVLLLNEREFGAHHYQYYMVAQTYYDYTDSIFALFPDGRVYKSGSMYLRPIEVSPGVLGEALRNARLVMNEPERARLSRLDLRAP